MCQCPERGDLHFYKLKSIKIVFTQNCVNALKGATFISMLEEIERCFTKEGCVNALKGATFISTEELMSKAKEQKLCQCPERGDLHFYVDRNKVFVAPYTRCVNALKGATFISTRTILFDRETDTMCQCPERGDLHFYRKMIFLFQRKFSCVNALKGATFISTIRNLGRSIYHGRCVNALKGATFISTEFYEREISGIYFVSMP